MQLSVKLHVELTMSLNQIHTVERDNNPKLHLSYKLGHDVNISDCTDSGTDNRLCYVRIDLTTPSELAKCSFNLLGESWRLKVLCPGGEIDARLILQ